MAPSLPSWTVLKVWKDVQNSQVILDVRVKYDEIPPHGFKVIVRDRQDEQTDALDRFQSIFPFGTGPGLWKIGVVFGNYSINGVVLSTHRSRKHMLLAVSMFNSLYCMTVNYKRKIKSKPYITSGRYTVPPLSWATQILAVASLIWTIPSPNVYRNLISFEPCLYRDGSKPRKWELYNSIYIYIYKVLVKIITSTLVKIVTSTLVQIPHPVSY